MKRSCMAGWTTAAMLFVTVLAGPASAGGFQAGVGQGHVTVADREKPIAVTLWYPSEGGGERVPIGRNGVFKGSEGQLNAPFAKGRFPLVLMTTGGFRSAPNSGAWLGRALAQQGFVVASITPPRLDEEDAVLAPDEIWKRPADMSAVLSSLLKDRELTGHIDTGRVAALGTALGGTSALSLAGFRLDAEAYSRSCDGNGDDVDCMWFAEKGVSLSDVDSAKIEADRRDERVKIAVAINPELTSSLAPDSFTSPSAVVAVAVLGADKRISEALRGAVPIQSVPEASKFSLFSECNPKGPDILKENGGNPAICTADDKQGRAKIHDLLSNWVAEILHDHFKTAK